MLQKDIVEETEDILETFNSKHDMLKRCILGMADTYQREVVDVEREILNTMYQEGRGHSVITVIGDIAIVAEVHKPRFPKAPFTASIKKEGIWGPINRYYSSLDHAVLGALGYKYWGPNSQFELFAVKMLGLPEG